MKIDAMRGLRLLACCAILLILPACGGGETTTDNNEPEPERFDEPDPGPDTAPNPGPDTAAEPEGDSAPAEAEGDSAPSGDEPDSAEAVTAAAAPGPEGFGDRLTDPRFPDAFDEGPESWPAWKPTHSIQEVVVPTNDGSTLTFKAGGSERLVQGEMYLEGDNFEARFKLFEGGTRLTFDRVKCLWAETGPNVELTCKDPTNKTVKNQYTISRSAGGFSMEQTARSAKKMKMAPRKIFVKEL